MYQIFITTVFFLFTKYKNITITTAGAICSYTVPQSKGNQCFIGLIILSVCLVLAALLEKLVINFNKIYRKGRP